MIYAALLGFGTVGSGVAEILSMNKDKIASDLGREIALKYILTRSKAKAADYHELLTDDIETIANDPEVSIVAECIGGVGAAYEYVKRCLEAGKHVVTSNKELVAVKGLELLQIAKSKKVCFLFEASVGGGIPIIRPLTNCLAGNRVEEICGILNGTTNYILTQMLQCSKGFDEALKEAQELGYAEADPTADVEGHDACRKICILADLCFGRNVDPSQVKTRGITAVSAEDAAFAEALGYSIKLLGKAARIEDKMTAFVAPHFVPEKELISKVNGVMNAIKVRGNAVGDCLFYGPGAGKLPTASAVVGDMIDCVRHEEGKKYVSWDAAEEGAFMDSDLFPTRWFIRSNDEAGLINVFGKVSARIGNEAAVITDFLSSKELRSKIKDLSILSRYRILD